MQVDYKPGAGGQFALTALKQAPADGQLLALSPPSPLTIFPSTFSKLSYEPFKDFAPVATACTFDFAFVVGANHPARTLAEFAAWCKANPRQASYGVPAAGSALHFAGMMLARASGVELQHVAYRGGAPLLQDVMGGQIPVSINVIGEVAPHIKAGKLRSLGVTSAQRSMFLPDVPTLAEQGFKDIVVQEWLGWFVPARTPADTVRRLNTLS